MKRGSLAEERPDLIKEWSEKNEFSPFNVSCGSHKRAVWVCDKKHEWSAVIKNRTINGSGCPYCNNRAVLEGFNDLATIHPELISEWSERNESLKITQVSEFSNKKAWWRCKNGHEWHALISSRSDGHGCPYCAGELIWLGFNDLQTVYPNISKEWSDRNKPLKPTEVFPKSTKNVWWHCSVCGNEYRAVITSRVKGLVCPFCVAKENERKRALKYFERMIEKDCISLFPQLTVIFYAGKKGLRAITDWNELVGFSVTVYLPELELAVDVCNSPKERSIKSYILNRHNITYLYIPNSFTELQIVDAIRNAFFKKHVFYDSDPLVDIATIKEKYRTWNIKNRGYED